MNLSDKTSEIQNDLGRFCLTGESVNIPGITPGRLKHYRRLVTNVITGTLDQAFPLAKKILSDKEWDQLKNDFMKYHKNQSNKIWKLPAEFFFWAKENNYAEKLNKEWLNDLLLFEWTEIEVFTMPDKDYDPYSNNFDEVFNDKINVNPEHRIIKLSYPVHLMKADKTPDHKGDYYVMMSRHPETGKVYFFNLTHLHVWIIENLKNDFTPGFLITQLPEIFGINITPEIKEKIKTFILDLKEKKAIY